MAKNDLTIDVTAHLTVSDEVADRCLAILEWWQNDHAEQRLMATTNADGSIHLYREKRNMLRRRCAIWALKGGELMNSGTFSYTRNNGWRSISPVERANAIVWLNEFTPTSQEEKRAKKIMTYFLCDNLSAQAICRKQDPDIVCYSNRQKGKPLSTTSILRVIYSYFPQFEGRNKKSTAGNKRVELIRKREKEESGHIKQCAFCGSKNNLEEHHMIPLYLGGTNDDENLIYLCKACHRRVSNYQARLRANR